MPQHIVGGPAPFGLPYISPPPTAEVWQLSPYHAQAPFLPATPYSAPFHPIHPSQGSPRSPAEKPYLHPSLNPTSNHLLTCDFSYPIELQSIDHTVLPQNATSIHGPMKISCHGYPYKIEVKPERGNLHVTVTVLLQKIYENMQTVVSPRESSALPASCLPHVGRANPRRMMRLDFLAGHRFAGLRLCDINDNHWRLHLV